MTALALILIKITPVEIYDGRQALVSANYCFNIIEDDPNHCSSWNPPGHLKHHPATPDITSNNAAPIESDLIQQSQTVAV